MIGSKSVGGSVATRSRASVGSAILAALAFACALLLVPSSALAAGPELAVRTSLPDAAQPGQAISSTVFIENVSPGPLTGDFRVKFLAPPGDVSYNSARDEGQPPVNGVYHQTGFSCQAISQGYECVTSGEDLPAGANINVSNKVTPAPSLTGVLPYRVEVSGPDGAPPVVIDNPISLSQSVPYEIQRFETEFEGRGAVDPYQAAATPGVDRTVFEFPTQDVSAFGNPNLAFNSPPETPRNIVTKLPPGLVGDPTALPKCTVGELGTNLPQGALASCAPETQVGIVHVDGSIIDPLFNLDPPPGVPAAFGFTIYGVPSVLFAKVRPSDHGIDIVASNIPAAIPLSEIEVAFWGVPASTSHDLLRSACLLPGIYGATGESCPSSEGAKPKPFLRTPTSCTGEPLQWGTEVETYQQPGHLLAKQAEMPAIEGCETVPFEPSITVQPTTHRADSPTGLNVDVTMPQEALRGDPNAIDQADLKDATVVQPIGTRINPAAANGLAGCSEADIGYEGSEFPQPNPIHFSGADPTCPESSKIGTVEIESPLLPDKLEGFVYLAKQNENPFGSTLAFYTVAEADGVLIKLPGLVETDPRTGQVKTVFRDSPELPFEHFKLHFFSGADAPLMTPPTCGSKVTEATITGWANPQSQVHRDDAFEITEAANGSVCPTSEARRPFAPSFEAGTVQPFAGQYSDFVFKISREDGTQELSGIEATLPKGLLGKLAGVPYCPAAAIASAQAASGLGEQAAPSCPLASQVGVSVAAAGAGPTPLYNPGKVYLAGPYKGAPLSLVIVTPAVAGPFDLGTVVVRAALQVDPNTAQVKVISDPIPSVLTSGGDGFPLDLRQVVVHVNHPDFILNPTSCEAMTIGLKVTAVQGASASPSVPFQAAECGKLPFKPKLVLRLKGKTKRSGNPALTATLTMPAGSADVARAQVALPHSEFLDQGHIKTICTRVQYAAGGGGGEQCPPGSIYGHAVAISPLLDKPLEGPVYLRSSSNPLPDLVASLGGQIHIDLDGRIDSHNGGIRTTFEAVPDAPVSTFTLRMQGGRKGLLENSTNICLGTHKATARFDAQNGKLADFNPPLQARCPKAKKGVGKKHRNGR